ncbi:T-lymphocyte activation antigen CD80 [Carettochelys insculpta]|uniref:T-lymphocyte activation antigen CD80 n=1 Tax=Carettochelys insculpta TaxID=44489 RepID=UPI003EB9966D
MVELRLPGLVLKRWFWWALLVLHFTSLVFTKEKIKVKARMGETAIMPCCHELSSLESLTHYRIYWQTKPPEVVIAYAGGQWVDNNPKYQNRTRMDLKNFTMWLSPVELSDKNTYECIVQETKGSPQKLCDVTVDLFVVADFSRPVISAEIPTHACGPTEVTVNCSSYGGFPKPRVSGLLNNVSVDWQTELPSSKSSLYNVTAKLQLNLTEDTHLTCTIKYDDFEVSSDYILNKLKDCLPPLSPSTSGVITASSLVLICIFLVALALLLKYFRSCACEHAGCSHHPVPQDPAVGSELKEVTSPHLSKVTSEAASF